VEEEYNVEVLVFFIKSSFNSLVNESDLFVGVVIVYPIHHHAN